MCLQDIAIGRSSAAYVRPVAITGAVQQVLQANPRRIAVILPNTPDDFLRWNHTGSLTGAVLNPTYTTGINTALGTFEGSVVMIGFQAFGAVAQLPLFVQGSAPIGIEVVEILLNVQTEEIK